MTDSGPNITTESTLGNEMFQSGPGTNIDNAPAVDTDMFMSGVSSSNEDPAKDFLEKEKENLGDLGLDLGIQNNEVQSASEVCYKGKEIKINLLFFYIGRINN